MLVSDKWSGKNLRDHKEDRRRWVMETLGIDEPEQVEKVRGLAWNQPRTFHPGISPDARNRRTQAMARGTRPRYATRIRSRSSKCFGSSPPSTKAA